MINARYFRRFAVIYERVSTAKQVKESEGSRNYQRAQRDHAIAYGWAEEMILVIDEDLGLSGATDDRPGYRRLLELIEQGKVGGVFISDMTRAGRDPVAWFKLLRLLENHDVLLFVDGHLTDPNDSSQMFVKEVEAVVTGRENRMRLETVHRGRLGKARKGKAVSAPPAGYVAKIEIGDGRVERTGKWDKDPNPRVRASFEAIFRVFSAQRSIVSLCKELVRQKIDVPARHGRQIVFVPPTVSQLRYILRSPAYAGVYVYGRRHLQRNGGEAGDSRPERLIGQVVQLPAHHEGYITPEQFAENQLIIKLNHNRRSCPSSRAALLQRRVRCGLHGYAMSVGYPGGRPAQFRCSGTNLRGGDVCITAPAAALERAVVPLVFQHLGPLALSDLRSECDDRRKELREAAGRAGETLRLAKRRLERTRRLFLDSDPDHREVKAILERELDEQALEVKRLEETPPGDRKEPPNPFTERLWYELERLWSNVVEIWDAPTTTIGDRIELLGAMITSVVVERDRERIIGRIVWEDGRPDTPFVCLMTAYFHRRIWELHNASLSDHEIAQGLNEIGGRNKQGRLWCKETVKRVISELRKKR